MECKAAKPLRAVRMSGEHDTVPGDMEQNKTESATLTVDEAARILGIGRSTAYDAVRAGQIPAIKIGRRLLIPRARFEREVLGIKQEEHA